MRLKEDILSYLFFGLLVYCIFLNYKVFQLEGAIETLARETIESRNHVMHTIDHGHAPLNVIPPQNTQLRPQHQPHAHSLPNMKLFDPSKIDVLTMKSPPPKVPPKLNTAEKRGIYGGVNDVKHLGGFTERDNNTISPNLWNFMLSEWAVKSVIDIGCGRGYSTRFFMDKGAKVLCLEGSHDAIQQSLLPRDRIVQHDFTMGPWWPEETYDVAWSTEFLEHVSRKYMDNYLPVFKKSALVMVTTSGWGGWHHVEVHAPWWWKSRMAARGLYFSEHLTKLIYDMIYYDDKIHIHGSQLMGMMVFINPAVASLPRHQHLFGGFGCYNDVIDNENGGIQCTDEVDVLPSSFHSLINCQRKGNGEATIYKDIPWDCKPNPLASNHQL